MIKNIDPRPLEGPTSGVGHSYPEQLLGGFGTHLYFRANDGVSGAELWRTNGTAAGTVLVADLTPGAGSTSLHSLAWYGSGRVFFGASSASLPEGLFTSDGTAAGTVGLRSMYVSPGTILNASGILYFGGAADGSGVELWRSDGTAAGTVMVRDVNPGGDATPASITPTEGFTYFVADDGAAGRELWRTDGTEDGTSRVADINAGPAGAGIAQITRFGNRLFFGADDGTTGAEPWMLAPVRPPAANAGPDLFVSPGASVTLDGSGSFDPDGDPLTFEWRDSSGTVVGTSALVTLTLPLGTHTLTLEVSDGALRSTDEVVVLVAEMTTLTVTVESFENGAGSVFLHPPNSVCSNVPGSPQTCTDVHPVGTLVWLDAIPMPDSVFLGWSGACLGTFPNCQVTLDQASNVVAIFRGPQPLTVTVESFENGAGNVYVNPPNSVCSNVPGSPQTCTDVHRVGTLVWLDAIPMPDSVFLGWSGACLGTFPNCQVTVDQASNVRAIFRGPQPLTVTVESFENGAGNVYVNPPNSVCSNVPGSPQTCTGLHRVGTLVWLDAIPMPDSVFLGWSGACLGTFPNCQVTVDQASNVRAIFRGPQPLTVTVESFENGAGNVYVNPPNSVCSNVPGSPQTCTDLHRVGTLVWLDAIPMPDSVFLGWSGACLGTFPNCQVTVDQASNVRAIFRGPQPLTVTVESFENGAGNVYISPPNSVCSNVPGSPLTCTSLYRVGTLVQLDAFPMPESVFLGWSGACLGTSPTCQVTVEQAQNVGAIFRGPTALTVTLEGTEGARGQVSIAPTGTVCELTGEPTTSCTTLHVPGSSVVISAQPDPGSVFVGWTGCVGTSSCFVTLDAATSVTATFRVNHIPMARPGGPYTGVRNGPVTFDGTASSDPDGDLLTHSWEFGDGSTGFGPSPSHTYGALGTYAVTLRVEDGRVGSTPVSTTVTISNRPPVAAIGGPYSGTHGHPVTFDASASVDPDGDPLQFAWSFGDGSTGTGAVPIHVYAVDGTYTVAVVVSDGVDASTASTVVTVTNAVPVAGAGGPYAAFKNAPVAFDGSASSDANGDALAYRWDFGDGTVGTGVRPMHAYGAAGTFTVRLVVNDGQQDSTAASALVTISNRPPVASPGGPYAGTRLQGVAFNGSASSDPNGDVLSYSWDFGDGATGTGATPSHTYTSVGTFTVTLVVSDGTMSSNAATTVTIANIAPLAKAGPDRTVRRRTTVTLDGRASSDADGAVAAFSWRQVSGPAVTLTGANTAVARFTAPNVFATTALVFELRVTDNHGAAATDQVRITVTR